MSDTVSQFRQIVKLLMNEEQSNEEQAIEEEDVNEEDAGTQVGHPYLLCSPL